MDQALDITLKYRDFLWFLKNAYKSIFKNFGGFLCSCIFLLVISVGSIFITAKTVETSLKVGAMTLNYQAGVMQVAISLISMFLLLNFFVYWFRETLGAKSHQRYFPIVQIDKSILNLFLLALSILLPVFLAMILIGLFTSIANLILPPLIAKILGIPIIICLMICFIIFPLRLSLALPLLSLNYEGSIKTALKASWWWTKGHAFKILCLITLSTLPFVLIGAVINFTILSQVMNEMSASAAHMEDMINFMRSPVMLINNFIQSILSFLGLAISINIISQVYLLLSRVKSLQEIQNR